MKERISPFEYDWIEAFQDGYISTYKMVWAEVKNGKTGLINGYGELIIPIIYDEIEGFSYGLAVVKRNGKYGL